MKQPPASAEAFTALMSKLPETPSAEDYRKFARLLLRWVEHLQPMGAGRSMDRLRFLMAVARRDLGLARLIEGHLDASQILREAGHPVAKDSLYGIWASGGPADTTAIVTGPDGEVLTGSKPFCSGSDLVDRALVYVYPTGQLVDVDMRAAAAARQLTFEAGQWITPAFAEIHTWTVRFDQTPLSDHEKIGSHQWYFNRPGFCLGAIAPAACWAGGAIGLVDSLRERSLNNDHARAHLGAMVSHVYSMTAMLNWGAAEIDADPLNKSGHQFATALLVRHHVERACTDILDRFGRTLGPRPLAFDAVNARRIAELNLYIRQCHAEQDLEELGRHLEENPGFCSGPDCPG